MTVQPVVVAAVVLVPLIMDATVPPIIAGEVPVTRVTLERNVIADQ
jgi:hypothetical protein